MEMQIRFPGGRRVDAHYRGFTIRTDQPARDGGAGSAPAPFDYFLGSLGTCAGLYVLDFLRERGLPTEGAELRLVTRKDPQGHRIAAIRLEVLLPAGFPEKYRNAVARAVDLCPVKRHLLEPPRFETVVEVRQTAGAEA